MEVVEALVQCCADLTLRNKVSHEIPAKIILPSVDQTVYFSSISKFCCFLGHFCTIVALTKAPVHYINSHQTDGQTDSKMPQTNKKTRTN